MENISVFDLVVTILLATATFWGGLRGVVSQISAIATWILSGLAAARYGSAVGEVVSIPEPWRAPVSALIVFCAALLALNVATRFVKRAISLAGLKEFDRQAGALFGFFKGCAICVVLTFFCVLSSEKTRDLVDKSKTGPYLASVSLLLKSAFPESETMTRFETLVSTMESTQAKGSAAPSLKSEIADLETYLKNNVLSKEAADVVEEAEAGAEAKKGVVSSGWSRFLNDLRERSAANGANESATTEARPSGSAASSENRENGESRGVWSDWNVWESQGSGEVRDGATNDGYYGEYNDGRDGSGYGEYSGYSGYGGYDEREGGARNKSFYAEERLAPYDGERGDETVETSNGWVDLTTFLTNLTGGARSASGANAANDATSGRRTANYAPAGEPLNDYLGVPASANARSAAPTFDAFAPRTTDGAILGRPNTTSTPLIPPLPY